MSESETPSEEEIEAKREELKSETQDARQKHEAQHNELLDAVASDDEIADYDTAEFGDVRVKHKSWLPGEELDRIKRAMNDDDMAGNEDEVKLLTNITEDITLPGSDTRYTDEESITLFWQDYLNKYGTDGYAAVMERMLGPIMEESQEKMEAVNSFQIEESRNGFRDGHEHDGPVPE